ncbi:MAG TPA: hypothetical protein VHL57_07045 [Flavobacteriales bacterium]|jgi:hypothetical protein|nr:hypothetical protein [Flavobacteriales bacterium]
MARWTLSSLIILGALLCTAAVSSGVVFGGQIILMILLGLMVLTLVKGLGRGGSN